uniref:Reverse transcriptase domain-containing protein n=1 Tax=Oreochromis niloticus TaxID=8128 RepID=A0A669E0K7_ORENI
MMKVSSLKTFYCILIYRPPGPAGVFLTEFNNLLTLIIKLEKVVILGDFNLHIDDASCNTAAELITIIESFNFKQHVSGHTLDLVFSLGLNIHDVCVEDVHVSDHSCIFFNLSFYVDPSPPKLMIQRRIINQDAAGSFSAMFDPGMAQNDMDSLILSFNNQCKSILDTVAPLKLTIVHSSNFCPWINENIRNFRRYCRKLERLWKASKLEVHRVHLKESILSLNDMIKNARTEYFANLIASKKKNPRVLFDTIKNIVSPDIPHVPVYTKSDCNDFLNYFVNKVAAVRSNISPSSSQYHTDTLLTSDTWSSFTPVTLQDVSALLGRMKLTSSHLDVLPPSFFISVFDSIGPCILEIINTSLYTGSVPSYFKQAIVEPILKKPNLDPSLPSSYRPISKLPLVSKILEKTVAEQLNNFLEKNNVLDIFQSGFRKLHSTETALLKVSSDILMAADSGEYTVLVLWDLSSAFDTVDHSIMINRLKDLFGITGVVLKWFQSYLSERSFTVCMNHVLSETSVLPSGVPQGSVLGPILFLLYILPLGQIIRRYNNISYHLYADDIQLYCSFKASEFYKLSCLNNCLSEIKQWLNDNFLQLNADKTETLIIAPDHMLSEIQQHISFLDPSFQSSLRNLGVIFDNSVSLENRDGYRLGFIRYRCQTGTFEMVLVLKRCSNRCLKNGEHKIGPKTSHVQLFFL